LEKHEHKENCIEFPLTLKVDYNHNHSVFSASAWKFHPVNDSTKESFKKMFGEGHSASDNYQKLLMETYKEEYVKISCDTAVMPTYRWIFYEHQKYMKENFGLLNSPESFRLAEEKVKKYNEKMGDEFAKVVQKVSGEFMIVVCDSLSRRVSEYVPQSGDILFMDATSNIDRGDSKFFRLITPSPAGGLPVGYIILSSERPNNRILFW